MPRGQHRRPQQFFWKRFIGGEWIAVSGLPSPFPGMPPHTTRQEPRCSSDWSVRGAQENRGKGSHASVAPGCVKSGWAYSALLQAGMRCWSRSARHPDSFSRKHNGCGTAGWCIECFFNLNRQVALHNIHYVCPEISTLLINCYSSHSSLFVGGVEMFSQEGTTQGDPLAMAIFRLATAPLIRRIATPNATQAWFADDAGCDGSLNSLRKWRDLLGNIGPQLDISWMQSRRYWSWSQTKKTRLSLCLRERVSLSMHLENAISVTSFFWGGFLTREGRGLCQPHEKARNYRQDSAPGCLCGFYFWGN